jgi:tetratricopeptide (TPR) repeat protein
MIRGTAKPAGARPYYQQALAIATSIAAQQEQARALEGLGRCHALEGNHSEERKILRQALAVYQRIGSCGCRKPMPPGDIHGSRHQRGHAAGPGTGPDW